MSIKAVIRKEFEFSPEAEDVEDRTVFILRPLTGDEFTLVSLSTKNEMTSKDLKDESYLRLIRRTLTGSLIGWRNFKHPETNAEIPYPETVVKAIDLIPFSIRNVIFSEVVAKSAVEQGVAKN